MNVAYCDVIRRYARDNLRDARTFSRISRVFLLHSREPFHPRNYMYSRGQKKLTFRFRCTKTMQERNGNETKQKRLNEYTIRHETKRKLHNKTETRKRNETAYEAHALVCFSVFPFHGHFDGSRNFPGSPRASAPRCCLCSLVFHKQLVYANVRHADAFSTKSPR